MLSIALHARVHDDVFDAIGAETVVIVVRPGDALADAEGKRWVDRVIRRTAVSEVPEGVLLVGLLHAPFSAFFEVLAMTLGRI